MLWVLEPNRKTTLRQFGWLVEIHRSPLDPFGIFGNMTQNYCPPPKKNQTLLWRFPLQGLDHYRARIFRPLSSKVQTQKRACLHIGKPRISIPPWHEVKWIWGSQCDISRIFPGSYPHNINIFAQLIMQFDAICRQEYVLYDPAASMRGHRFSKSMAWHSHFLHEGHEERPWITMINVYSI